MLTRLEMVTLGLILCKKYSRWEIELADTVWSLFSLQQVEK